MKVISTTQVPLVREQQMRAYHAQKVEAGEAVVPLAALLLGCSNCRMTEQRPGERTLYCAVCPVTRRKRLASARAKGESTYRWQGVDVPTGHAP
jgi:hypothetical protein